MAVDLRRPRGNLAAGMEAQLVADLLDVVFGGAFADEQLLRDLPVGQALSDEVRDFLLAAGQRPRRAAGVVSGGACRTDLVRNPLRGSPPRSL
jgi:hypothetical protein